MEPGGRKRRESMDIPLHFSLLTSTAAPHATSFMREFENSEPKMRQIVDELQQIAAQGYGRVTAALAVGGVTAAVFAASAQATVGALVAEADAAGAVAAGAGAAGVGAAAAGAAAGAVAAGAGAAAGAVAAGAGAVVAGAVVAAGAGAVAAGAVAAGAVAAAVTALVGLKQKYLTAKEESKKKVKEFLEISALLMRELEEIKKVCEDLQRESVGAETENIITLESNIQNLFITTANIKLPASADHLTEVTSLCEKAVNELSNLKTNLKSFTESTEPESKQNEL